MSVAPASRRPVCMITGASRGIGRATALAFARAGFDIIITARTEVEGQASVHGLTDSRGATLPGSLAGTTAALAAVHQDGGQTLALAMDLLDSASVERAAAAALQRFGHVDVLINNAVYQGRDLNASLDALDEATLARVWQGYVSAPLQLTRRLLPGMIESGHGCIINVTSGAGEKDPPVPASEGGWGYAYGAGKAAVSRLAGILVAEYGKQGICAYTVNPGVVNTEALRATIGEDGEMARRYGAAAPEMPAEVMLWLATAPAAAAYQRRTINARDLASEHALAA